MITGRREGHRERDVGVGRKKRDMMGETEAVRGKHEWSGKGERRERGTDRGWAK